MIRPASILLITLLVAAVTAFAQPVSVEPPSAWCSDVQPKIVTEACTYAEDARILALRPLHWRRDEWRKAAYAAVIVAAIAAADHTIYQSLQQNRTGTSDAFARAVTPLGAEQAFGITLAMLSAGAATGNTRLWATGRDALEAQILAGGIITPLLKLSMGRERPISGEGAASFDPFSGDDFSFPSGHTTNAFALASVIAAHQDGWVVPTIAYSLASGVAVARVHDQKHYPSDVLVGAIIGTAVGRFTVARHRSRDAEVARIYSVQPYATRDGTGIRIAVRF